MELKQMNQTKPVFCWYSMVDQMKIEKSSFVV